MECRAAHQCVWFHAANDCRAKRRTGAVFHALSSCCLSLLLPLCWALVAVLSRNLLSGACPPPITVLTSVGSPPCPPRPSARFPSPNPVIPPLPALPILQMMPPLRTLWGIDQVAPRQDGAGREGRCHSRSELEAICSELR